jgi:hypothetical protein
MGERNMYTILIGNCREENNRESNANRFTLKYILKKQGVRMCGRD